MAIAGVHSSHKHLWVIEDDADDNFCRLSCISLLHILFRFPSLQLTTGPWRTTLPTTLTSEICTCRLSSTRKSVMCAASLPRRQISDTLMSHSSSSSSNSFRELPHRHLAHTLLTWQEYLWTLSNAPMSYPRTLHNSSRKSFRTNKRKMLRQGCLLSHKPTLPTSSTWAPASFKCQPILLGRRKCCWGWKRLSADIFNNPKTFHILIAFWHNCFAISAAFD